MKEQMKKKRNQIIIRNKIMEKVQLSLTEFHNDKYEY